MASSENLTFESRNFDDKDVDFFNVLPEDVVSHILSYLPTQEAIKTSILSKRWRFLWATISNLDFSDENEINRAYYDEHGRKKFIDYVSSVLRRLDPRKSIDKLSISLKFYHDVLEVENWVSRALQRNVKDLTLSLYSYNSGPSGYRMEVPREVFDCKSLEALRLCVAVHLKIPNEGFVCFQNLKFLSLKGYASISGIPAQEHSPCFPKLENLCLDRVVYEGKDDCVMKLIRNCPLLKDVSIHIVLESNVSNLSMSIPQLTTLVLTCGYYLSSNVGLKVEIEAPIKHLKVSLWNPTQKFIVKNPDSLIRAELRSDKTKGFHFQREQQDEMLKLLKTVDNVKYLLLCIDMINAIKVSKIKLPLFGNLIQLEVWLSCENLSMLESFLNSTINLQSLVINKIWLPGCRGQDKQCIGDGQWTEFSHVPKCLINSLKTIEMRHALDCPGELNMIELMLKSAKVLEVFTTKPSSYSSMMSYSSMYKRDINSLRQKISAFPQASPACQFYFLPAIHYLKSLSM